MLWALTVALVAVLVVVSGGVLLADQWSAPPAARPGAAGSPGPSDLAPLETVRIDSVDQFAGPRHAQRGTSTTSGQEQTKLWFAGGAWWGLMVAKDSGETHIFGWREDRWQDTGTLVDLRKRSHGDAIWTGRRLYVASRLSNGMLLLTRFRLTKNLRWVALDTTPVLIAGGGATSLSIDVDSQERVWAVFNRDGQMWIANSNSGGRAFSRARLLPGPNSVKRDDTAGVLASAEGIAVLWSDQVRGMFRFAIRKDTDPRRFIRLTKPPLSGERIADGHIRMLAADDGRILAVVKTSLGDAAVDAPRSPLMFVLVRSPDGKWTRSVAATTDDQMTRPQILLSEDGKRLFFLATAPQTGGSVYLKIADAQSLVFSAGRGTLILESAGAHINYATVTRQRVPADGDLLVLASAKDSTTYYTSRIVLRRQ